MRLAVRNSDYRRIDSSIEVPTLDYILTRRSSPELEKSTQMFGILADPNGANNALGQVLYGLALR